MFLTIAVVISVLGLTVYVFVVSDATRHIDDNLVSTQHITEVRVSSGAAADPGPVTRARQQLAQEGGFAAIGRDNAGHDIALLPLQDGTAPGIPAQAWQNARKNASYLFSLRFAGQDFRVDSFALPRPVTYIFNGQLHTFVAYSYAQSLSTQEASHASLLQALIVVGAMGALASIPIAWFMARQGLRPLSQLTTAVERIGQEGDLGRRLPAARTRGEVERLVSAFNASLSRLEHTYQELEQTYKQMEHLLRQQQQFVADASHELRTPLTTIRTSIDSLRRHPRMVAEDRDEALSDADAEVQRMVKLLNDLLVLARMDAGVQLNFERVNWDVLGAEMHRDAERLCAPRHVMVEVDDDLGSGTGDHDSLLRVGRIVFDNIAKYTPSTTTVTLHMARYQGTIVIDISDNGSGVDEQLLPRIFDRFFQADPSRQSGGSGLGLAIAAELVAAHKGTMTASRAAEGGLHLHIEIPL